MSYIKERMHELAIKHAWEIVDHSVIGMTCSAHGKRSWAVWQTEIEAELLEHYEVLDYLEDVDQHIGCQGNIYAFICEQAGNHFYTNHNLSLLYDYEWED